MWHSLKRHLCVFLLSMSLFPLMFSIAQAQGNEAKITAESTSGAQITYARKSFDSAKEQRLEDLRYKHLWIAYSLVWLVIFLFIRQTWRRSQAVAGRLDELKTRLVALEDDRK